VKQANGESWLLACLDLLSDVRSYFSMAVTDAVHGRQSKAVADYWDRLHLISTEKVYPCRPGDASRPSVKRVVIPEHYEGFDPGSRQAGQAVTESKLRPEATVSAVIDVSRDQDEVHLLPERGLDDSIIGRKGRLLQGANHTFRR
jgi:hypothetical protein